MAGAEGELPPELAAHRCECNDCDSAVSPRAYLAALLDYVTTHVAAFSHDPYADDEGEPLTLDRIAELFHQPVGDLPATCDGNEETVRHVRLCVEVLLGMLADGGGSEAVTDFVTDDATAEYRRTAYRRLLAEWDTDPQELRAAEYDEAARERVAELVGIPAERVADLRLDPTAAADAADAATEAALAEIFGYPETVTETASGWARADPLSSPDSPSIGQWRLERLREDWERGDHPEDPFATRYDGPNATLEESGERPVVDPDVINPDDFRTPTDDSPAFGLWTRRREWVDGQLAAAWEHAPRGLAALLEWADNPVTYDGQSHPAPWTNWDRSDWRGATTREKLLSVAEDFEGDDGNAATVVTDDLNLNESGFTRLVELVRKERRSREDGLSDAEYWHAGSILVGARKRSLADVWLAEEADRDVHLGPKTFWLSQREPKEGDRVPDELDGIAAVSTGTFSTPTDPGSVSVADVGFRPDLIVLTASPATASGQSGTSGERSGSVGWAHGAVRRRGDDTLEQVATSLVTDSSGSDAATADTRTGAALTFAARDGGPAGVLRGTVTTTTARGFDIRFDRVDAGAEQGIVVEYAAYKTADGASADVGHFLTPASATTQTVPLDVDATHVRLTGNGAAAAANATRTTGDAAPFSRGEVVGRDAASQSVQSVTLGLDDGASVASAAYDDRALYLPLQSGDRIEGATSASVTSLGDSIDLDYGSVATGGNEARRVVTYVAVETGAESQPDVGHVATSTSTGTVSVTTGFRPELIEFEAWSTVDAVGSEEVVSGPLAWSSGAASGTDRQHVVGHAHGGPDATGHASAASTDDAVSLAYVDDDGAVTGTDVARVSAIADSGFELDVSSVATPADSTAPHSQVLVFYRAWPVSVSVDERRTPFVDPERIARSDLPETTFGEAVRDLYDARGEELGAIRAELEAAYYDAGTDANPIDAVLTAVFGGRDWGTVLEEIRVALDADREPLALDRLSLSTESFETVWRLRTQSESGDDGSPDDAVLDDLFGTLTSIAKRRRHYAADGSGWRAAERSAGLDRYWQAYKATLPPYRGGADRRAAWQRALIARSNPPIVDPDLIESVDAFTPPATDQAAFDLWTARESALDDLAGPRGRIGAAIRDQIDDTTDSRPYDFVAARPRYGRLLTRRIGISLEELGDLAEQRADGAEIAPRVGQLNLTLAEFDHLARVRSSLVAETPLEPDEWRSVEHILVQVHKRREFGVWRRAERANGIVLDPRQFDLQSVEEGNERERVPAVDEEDPQRWRYDTGVRRNWLDTLETRTEQREGIAAEIDDAVTAAETAALPRRRERLIEAIETPDLRDTPAADAAEWLSERLLIDVEAYPEKETTRVSQAITSIQTLLSALSVRGLDVGRSTIRIDEELTTFHRRWEWLGTYPSWRAAMGVFLYPENVLNPTLRSRKTPGFERLEEAVPDGRATPGQLVDAIESYQRYYLDVASLEPAAACMTRWPGTGDSDGDGDSTGGGNENGNGDANDGDAPDAIYVVGESGYSDGVYYRWCDVPNPVSPPERAPSYWREISVEEPLTAVAGATRYEGTIYLFVWSEDRFGYLTHDPGDDGWSSFTEVPTPDVDDIAAVQVVRRRDGSHPPELVATVPRENYRSSYTAHYVRFAESDDEIPPSSDEWREFFEEYGITNAEPLVAAVDRDLWWLTDHGAHFSPYSIPAGTVGASYGDLGATEAGYVSDAFEPDGLLFVPEGPETSRWESSKGIKLVAFDGKSSLLGGEPVETVTIADPGKLGTDTPTDALGDVRFEAEPAAGREEDVGILSVNNSHIDLPGGLTDVASFFVAERPSLWGDSPNAGLRLSGTYRLDEAETLREIPGELYKVPADRLRDDLMSGPGVDDVWGTDLRDVAGTLQINLLEEDHYETYQDRTKDLYQAHRHSDWKQNAIYVREAYYSVPLFLSRKLANKGYHEQALDLYRVIYEWPLDEDAVSSPAERWVWYGLKAEQEQAVADEFAPDADWLLDPIDPHGLAEHRPNAYTRFTLFSILQCLLAYADDEFARDTRESVSTARTLYESALDVLADPAARDRGDPCAELLADLETQLETRLVDAAIWDREDVALSRAEVLAHKRDIYEDVKSLRDFEDRYRAAREIVAHLRAGEVREAAAAADAWAEGDDALTTYRSVSPTAESEAADRLADPPVARSLRNAAGQLAKLVATGDGHRAWRTYSSGISGAAPSSIDSTREDAGTLPPEDATELSDPGGTPDESPLDSSVGETLPVVAPPALPADADATGPGIARSSALSGRLYTDPAIWSVVDELSTGNGSTDDPAAIALSGTTGDPWAPQYDVGPATTRASMDLLAATSNEFCVPENPVLDALRRHATLNLRKIRHGRNIAGMKREIDPYAASADVEDAAPSLGGAGAGAGVGVGPGQQVQPTNYRYDTLIQRAQSLAETAQQMESKYLDALQKLQDEQYKLKSAKQDLELAEERISLQDTRLRRARNKGDLVRLQKRRSQIRAETYEQWIDAGLNQFERRMISAYQRAGEARMRANRLGMQESLYRMMSNAATGGPAAAAAMAFTATAQMFNMAETSARNAAIAADTTAKIASVRASQARREQRWQLKRKLAEHNRRIQDQKLTLARDSIDIIEQEREIAELETDHARDIVNFHQNKFLDAEMYRWMSDVLKRIYRYFLRQAAAVARLAQQQLAFERQEMPRQFIQADYWDLPSEGETGPVGDSGDDEGPDRRGLTASARLRRDITELDQYEFRTDERRLRVEKTISLAELDPIALQQFRETGTLPFETTLEQFSYDHPGQYLRLIENVAVDIVALTPPDAGINATLETSGTSRVVVGDQLFREKVVSRDPETVALSRAHTDPSERTRLEPDESGRLRPFENMGVAADWNLRMPRAANDFDFSTIQDVRLTITYSAFESHQYRRQVQDRIGTERSRQRAFSLNEDFADAWYDLRNPDQTATPHTVRFHIDDADVPATLTDIELSGVQLYLVGPISKNEREDLRDVEWALSLRRPDGTTVEATERPIDGIVSTDAFGGTAPTGTWKLTVSPPDSGPVSEPFRDGRIEDVLVILGLEGHVPGWPE